MLEALALIIVVSTGIYLIALALASLLTPARATRFLLGFASSPRVHFIELFARILIGAAFVIFASNTFSPGIFRLFGWVLLVTTACLLALPWRWHRWFAQQAVPRATPFIKVIGLCSLALGVFVLFSVIRGNAV